MSRSIAVISFCLFALVTGDGAAQTPVSPTPAQTPGWWIPDARSNIDSLIGWPSGQRVVAERRWEDRFVAMPSAANALEIEKNLSSVPHRAGTPADYKTALFFRDRLRQDGFDARLEEYQVQFTTPVEQRLAIVSPDPEQLDLLEGQPGRHTAYEQMAGPAFEENSGDGDVTGALFYLNTGSAEDWKTFDALGVTMPPNSIVIEHLGGFGGRDPNAGQRNWDELVKHRVAGLLQYWDPRSDGVYRGDVWPHGNFKNSYMAERIGGPTPHGGPGRAPGDPTLPGEAPLPGKAHLSWQQAVGTPILEMTITQAVARKLLSSLSGHIVPDAWHDGFEMVERVGDGRTKVHYVVKMNRKIVSIWNVFGALRGAAKPDEIVMIGSHRDAMTFGAIDPGSGSTVMLQVADAFKRMHDAGWNPDRTIEIASWDGHELGLWGSISQAYKEGPELRKHVVQYINTDQLTNGPPFRAGMSPELWAFGREIAAYVKDPSGNPILASENSKDPSFGQPGGGSDHQTFIYWLGIPSSTVGFYGHFGAHHTAEDNLDGLKTYDPGFGEAVAMAQYTGVQAMRAAGAERMPLRLTEVTMQLAADVAAARKMPQYSGVDFSGLEDKVKAYHAAAVAFDAKLSAAERGGDATLLDALEARAARARDVFWMPDGLSYNKWWHTIDRNVAALPELNYAAFETQDRDAKVNAALGRLIDAIDRAITDLSS